MITSIFHSLLSILYPPRCIACKKSGAALCEPCLHGIKRSYTSPHPFIRSVYLFKDPLTKKIIHAIKYFHRKDLIAPLAESLAETLSKDKIVGTLIPVPMHPLRQSMRGYNHALELASAISKVSGLPCEPRLLRRTGYAKQQVKTKHRSDRLRNQHNAFSVSRKLEGETFIIIDDVTTTGTTLLEARKILLANGAGNVYGLTIAH